MTRAQTALALAGQERLMARPYAGAGHYGLVGPAALRNKAQPSVPLGSEKQAAAQYWGYRI